MFIFFVSKSRELFSQFWKTLSLSSSQCYKVFLIKIGLVVIEIFALRWDMQELCGLPWLHEYHLIIENRIVSMVSYLCYMNHV